MSRAAPVAPAAAVAPTAVPGAGPPAVQAIPRGGGGQAPPAAAPPDGEKGGGKTSRAVQTAPREIPNPGTAAR
jgi:hypothetical protein